MMAKMFYSLQEAAEKLGVSEEQIRQMTAQGTLHQFRDRDKIMFRREEVDALAEYQPTGLTGLSQAAEPDSNLDPIPLSDLDDGDTDTDLISLTSKPASPLEYGGESSIAVTNVFDDDEPQSSEAPLSSKRPEPVSDEDEIALENVGSGSGLLDLTRESDDTSLGAELLDEIYPSSGEASDAKLELGPSASGVFDGDLIAAEAGSATGLENLQAVGETGPVIPTMSLSLEDHDPEGSGMAGGMLLGALMAVFLSLMVITFAAAGFPSGLTRMLAGNSLIYSGALLALSGVFAVAGFMIGRAQNR